MCVITKWSGQSDEEIFSKALSEDRILVSQDTDFGAVIQGEADMVITDNPLGALGEPGPRSELRLALNAATYSNRNPILYKGPEKVSPAELFLASVSALTQKTVEGLVQSENRIIEAKGREALNPFRVLLESKILSEAARQAMARAA